MKFLVIHPSALMYTRVFLRLEPLGLELIGEVAAGPDTKFVCWIYRSQPTKSMALSSINGDRM